MYVYIEISIFVCICFILAMLYKADRIHEYVLVLQMTVGLKQILTHVKKWWTQYRLPYAGPQYVDHTSWLGTHIPWESWWKRETLLTAQLVDHMQWIIGSRRPIRVWPWKLNNICMHAYTLLQLIDSVKRVTFTLIYFATIAYTASILLISIFARH